MDGNRPFGPVVAPPDRAGWLARAMAAKRALASPVGARVAAVLVLCAASLYANFGGIRYETAFSSIVPSGFDTNWPHTPWGVRRGAQDRTIVDVARVPDREFSYAVRTLPRIGGVDGLRIGVEGRSAGVVDGPKPWQNARVILLSFDAKGKRLRYVPYEVLALDGTTDWTRGQAVIPFVPETARLNLAIVNAALAGEIAVRNLTVDAVRETPVYRELRNLLVALWVLVGAWALYPVLLHPLLRRGTNGRAHLAVTVIGGVLLAGVLAPEPTLERAIAAVKHDVARPLMAAIVGENVSSRRAPMDASATAPAAAPPAAEPSEPAGDSRVATAVTAALDRAPPLDLDFGHVMGFATLALALVFAFPTARRRDLFAALVLLGAAIEVVQSFYVSRSAETSDLARDTAGAAAGIALALLWLWLRARRALRHNALP